MNQKEQRREICFNLPLDGTTSIVVLCGFGVLAPVSGMWGDVPWPVVGWAGVTGLPVNVGIIGGLVLTT